jgi:hypothetical protein
VEFTRGGKGDRDVGGCGIGGVPLVIWLIRAVVALPIPILGWRQCDGFVTRARAPKLIPTGSRRRSQGSAATAALLLLLTRSSL